MPMIAIKIPEDISIQLNKISISGKKENLNEFHITLFYFEKINIEDILKTTELLYKNCKKASPFKVSFNKLSSFPKGDDGIPVILPVESNDLILFRAKLAKNLDSNKIEYSKKFPNYSPHCTLAYLNKEIAPQEKKLNKINFKVNEIIFYAGDNMDDGIIVKIPLGEISKNAGLLIWSELFNNISH